MQYTRNMATGASTADLAIILIDARLGVLKQSRRHAFIASLLGIRELAVCVNKMDLCGFDSAVFEKIRGDFRAFAEQLGFSGVTFVPISAKEGDNVVRRSTRTPWYSGPTVLEHLEQAPLSGTTTADPFRYPVQGVLRPNLDYRAFSGQIASGTVEKGDEVMVLPSEKRSRVASIDTYDGELERAFAPQSVALRLTDEVDISRGDMIVHPDARPTVGRRFDAMLVWMSERPLDQKKSYFLKHTTQYVRAEVERIVYTVDLESLDHVSAASLELNDIARASVMCHRPIFFDPYAMSRSTGAFVLIDSITNDTVAAGMIVGESREKLASRSTDQAHSQVSPAERQARTGQRGGVVWLTGLPRSGKSTLAYALERRLFDRGAIALVVDPEADETQSSTLVVDASVLARRLADASLLVIFVYDSPIAAERDAVREKVGADRFVDVHVATPLEVCKKRDDRGIFSESREGQTYEPPSTPAMTLSVDGQDVEILAESICAELVRRGLV